MNHKKELLRKEPMGTNIGASTFRRAGSCLAEACFLGSTRETP